MSRADRHRGCRSVGLGVAVLLSISVSGCGLLGNLFPADFSGFEEFTYELHPALGLCADAGDVLGASILRAEDGSYRLTMELLDEVLGSFDECPVGSELRSWTCLRVSTLPGRVLTESEVAEVVSVFRSVRLELSRDPICFRAIVDPCRIDSFLWDTFEARSYVCSPRPRLEGEQLAEILDLLEGLRANWE